MCQAYDANKNSGIVWDEGTFKEYIKDPKAKIPGTKMAFPGIKNEKEIDDLWSFIEQFGPDGKKEMSNLALDSPCLQWPHRYCSSCLSCREAGE